MSRFVISQAGADGGSSDEDEDVINLDDSLRDFIDDTPLDDDASEEESTPLEVLPDLESSDDEAIRPVSPVTAPPAYAGVRRPIIVDDDDDVPSSPEAKRRCKTGAKLVQTSPSLLRTYIAELQATASGDGKPEERKQPASQTVEEQVTCSICMDVWTTEGEHRLVSLKCGHCFGMSCVNRWLQGLPAKERRCPQCNTKAKPSEVRQLYVKSIKAIDTSELDETKKELEKYRSKYQSSDRQASIMEARLREADEKIQALNKQLLSQQHSSRLQPAGRSILPPKTVKSEKALFKPMQSINVNPSGSCRTLTHSSVLEMLVVSCPSSNPLFSNRFGIRCVNTSDYIVNDFMVIHNKVIKDMVFKPGDPLLLSASLDKTMKISNLVARQVTTTFNLEHDAWSCCWNTERTTSCYAGLKNGTVVEFDIRQPNAPLQSFAAFDTSPVQSIHHVVNNNNEVIEDDADSLINGLYCTSLASNYFHEFSASDPTYYQIHSLPFEGKFLPGHYDPVSGYGLTSTRPSTRATNMTHSLIEFGKLDDAISANIARRYEGGAVSVNISKSKVFSDPSAIDRKALVFAVDEAAKGTYVWDSTTGQHLQLLKTGGAKVADIELLRATEDKFTIALLSDQRVFVFERNTNTK